MIHLDTSFLIRALVAGSKEDARLRRWIRDGEGLRMSAIAWSEFLCGPIDAPAIDLVSRIVGDPEPFLSEDGVVTARLFNDSGRRRGALLDCMIAAVASRDRARIATTNVADFRRLVAAGGPDLA